MPITFEIAQHRPHKGLIRRVETEGPDVFSANIYRDDRCVGVLGPYATEAEAVAAAEKEVGHQRAADEFYARWADAEMD